MPRSLSISESQGRRNAERMRGVVRLMLTDEIQRLSAESSRYYRLWSKTNNATLKSTAEHHRRDAEALTRYLKRLGRNTVHHVPQENRTDGKSGTGSAGENRPHCDQGS